LKGLLELCKEKAINQAFLITKSLDDFGLIKDMPARYATRIMQIPAALLCYWMGEIEFMQNKIVE
jgi:hypothetical protein